MTVRVCLSAILSAAALLAQKTPDQALTTLRDGNARFAAERPVVPPLGEGFRRSLCRGQSPYAIVLTCADSRVAPEHVFNAGLGELFVVRIAGNSCDPETLASIEYAAEHLAVPLCVVLGHEGCGAIAAAVQSVQQPRAAETPALAHLLERLQPAVRKALAEQLGGVELCRRAEEEHAQQTAVDCLRQSPVLQLLQQQQRFRIVPARYHQGSGEVEWLPERPLLRPEPVVGHAAEGKPGLPPHVALQLLQAGHRRFLSASKPTGDVSRARRQDLVHGQHPLAIVVTCADSRVPPEHLFDAGLGELFVIRLAGNVLNDEALASIEYAAAHTGAGLLVVLGHSQCGAVTAATGPELPHATPSMRSLLDRLQPAVERARQGGGDGAGLVAAAVRGNVLRTLQLARAQSSLLRGLEQEGRFAMVPAVYDLASGDIEWLKDHGAPAVEPAAAMPPAAPMGEGAPTPHPAQVPDAHAGPVHGEVAKPAADAHADPHRQPDASPAGSHQPPAGGASHGDAAHGEHAQPAPHEGLAPHAAEPDQVLPRPYGIAPGHREAAGHDARAAAPVHREGDPQPWWRAVDPSLVFGGLGMASLLVALMLVLQRRS